MLKKMRNNKKGFTLAELLIVVAIIAVLVAIAIPSFAASLNQAKAAKWESNARAVHGEAMSHYLSNGSPSGENKFESVEIDGDKYIWTYNNKGTTVSGNTVVSDNFVAQVSVSAGGKEWDAGIAALIKTGAFNTSDSMYYYTITGGGDYSFSS